MLNLNGELGFDDVLSVNNYTTQRFKDKHKLLCPEALTLHEQDYLPDETIKRLCEEAYQHELFEPIASYVPEEVVQKFEGTGYVPVIFEPAPNKVTVVYVDDLKHDDGLCDRLYNLEKLPTTLYYYFSVYQKYYGVHECLNQVAPKLLFDDIINEAINLGAIDITISTDNKSTVVYYNVRKRKVHSKKIFSYEFIIDVIKLLTIKSPMDLTSCKPKDVDIDLNTAYRGRVLINAKTGGYTITIRLLPNEAFTTDISKLGLGEKSQAWLKETFLDTKPGLRLMVGATMSGKNTTILSVLRELASTDNYKIVSIEMPVEQKLPGIEQISCEKEEEFEANIRSLIRMNPDFVYVTEIRDSTGLVVTQITNTGKCVFSTLHANSVSDTISRLVDITKLSQDRVIQSLHSVCFQKLVRDEENDRLYPENRFVYFSDELKYKLYGKSLGEVVKIINDVEDGD